VFPFLAAVSDERSYHFSATKEHGEPCHGARA